MPKAPLVLRLHGAITFRQLPVLEKLHSSLEGGTKVMKTIVLGPKFTEGFGFRRGDSLILGCSKRYSVDTWNDEDGDVKAVGEWFLRPRFLDKLLAATFGGMQRH